MMKGAVMENLNRTYDECSTDLEGTIYADWMEEDLRCVILRGPYNLCAYIGLPEGHDLYGINYYHIDLPVHGGLTFGSDQHTNLPSDRWWLGWDYGHYQDADFCDLNFSIPFANLTFWTPAMVFAEFAEPLQYLKEEAWKQC